MMHEFSRDWLRESARAAWALALARLAASACVLVRSTAWIESLPWAESNGSTTSLATTTLSRRRRRRCRRGWTRGEEVRGVSDESPRERAVYGRARSGHRHAHVWGTRRTAAARRTESEGNRSAVNDAELLITYHAEAVYNGRPILHSNAPHRKPLTMHERRQVGRATGSAALGSEAGAPCGVHTRGLAGALAAKSARKISHRKPLTMDEICRWYVWNSGCALSHRKRLMMHDFNRAWSCKTQLREGSDRALRAAAEIQDQPLTTPNLWLPAMPKLASDGSILRCEARIVSRLRCMNAHRWSWNLTARWQQPHHKPLMMHECARCDCRTCAVAARECAVRGRAGSGYGHAHIRGTRRTAAEGKKVDQPLTTPTSSLPILHSDTRIVSRLR